MTENKHIPSAIKKAAQESSCNEITYVGRIDNADVWNYSEVDEDGMAVPNGLPLLIKDYGNRKIEKVSGQAALELLASLEA